MKKKYQHLFVACLLIGLGVGLSGLQAAAAETGGANSASSSPTAGFNPAPATSPTSASSSPTAGFNPAPAMSPAQVSEKTTPATTSWSGEKKSECRKRKKELELNWNVAIGTATYEENSQENSLSSMGAMLEINPGNFVTTAPGLDIGMVVGFLFLTSDGAFNVSYAGPPATQRNWEVAAMSVGSYVLAKYSYEIDLDVMTIGLENGLGVGYFISNVDAEWVDASDSNITGDTSEDNHNWAPVLKAGLKIAFPVTDVSSLGLNLGANLIPLIAGDYNNFITISAGLNYQVRY